MKRVESGCPESHSVVELLDGTGLSWRDSIEKTTHRRCGLAWLQFLCELRCGDDRVSASQREEVAVPGYQEASTTSDERRQDRRVVGIIRL